MNVVAQMQAPVTKRW